MNVLEDLSETEGRLNPRSIKTWQVFSQSTFGVLVVPFCNCRLRILPGRCSPFSPPGELGR